MNPTKPQSILVIMLRRIGDVILTTPAVRALKKLYPGAQIDFLVEPPSHQILEGNPDIRELLVYGSHFPNSGRILSGVQEYFHWLRLVRQKHYDWVIDYMGNPRSAVITALSGAAVRAGPGHVSHRWAYSHRYMQSDKPCYSALEKIRALSSLGLHPDESDYMPRISLSAKSGLWAETTIKLLLSSDGKQPAEPLIGFIPASRKITRQWPAASYAELGRLLRSREHARVIVFWGPGEKSLAAEVVRGIGASACLAPKTETLKELAALIGQCQLMVTNCNGPKHIAVALQVPTLTIHGSSDPVCWNPPDRMQHQVARLEELFCIGCRSNACPYDLECMKNLSAERVFTQAQQMLSQRGRVPETAGKQIGRSHHG